jgi:hypothetical protein
MFPIVTVAMLVVGGCTQGEEAAINEVTTSTTVATTAVSGATATTWAVTTTTQSGGNGSSDESIGGPILSGRSLAEGWIPVLGPDEMHGVGGGSAMRLAVADFGVVAVGYTCESIDATNTSADCSASAWVSEDGFDWTKVYGEEAGLADGMMRAVAAGGPGVVAVGTSCGPVDAPPEGCVPAIWTSTNGYDWDSIPTADGVFTNCPTWDTCVLWDVANTGSRLVATGWDGSGFGVWTSPDGIEWTRVVFDPDKFVPAVSFTPQVPGEGEFFNLLAVDGRVVAFGQVTLFEYEGDEFIEWWYPAAVWTSPDGEEWTQPDNVFGQLDDTEIVDETVWRDRIYATGWLCDHNDDCEPVMWSSTDGSEWTVTPFESNLESIMPHRTYGLSDALLITGSLRGQPVALTTTDGTTWEIHNLDPGLFRPEGPGNDLIRYRDLLIMVGRQITVWNP